MTSSDNKELKDKPHRTVTALGLMSGTSMDGIDAGVILTDGSRYVKELGSHSLKYSADFKAQLRSAERAVLEAQGDMQRARSIFPELDKVVQESTLLHAQVAQELISKLGYTAAQIDLIGYHGQTLFHRPAAGITIQVGDGALLARTLGIPVVYDFRSNDVRHGGQGAPFAPLYHEALALQRGLVPAVFANCGGISNITVVTGVSSTLMAFDCGPGNALIDRFVLQRSAGAMDLDGVFGLQGSVQDSVLKALCAKSLLLQDGSNYLDKTPPKSLDVNDLILIDEVRDLSLYDGCATLEAFTADCIVDSLTWVEQSGVTIPNNWVLSGGGWNNPVTLRELQLRLGRRIGNSIKIQHADAIGWDGAALEAQIFAYLAVRSIAGLPLSVPGTTGVPEPLTGGVFAQ